MPGRAGGSNPAKNYQLDVMGIGIEDHQVNSELHDFSDEAEVEQSELAETEDGAIFARRPADAEIAAQIEADDEAAAEQAEIETDLPQRVSKPAGPKRQPPVSRAEERALIARVKSGEPGAKEALRKRFIGFLIDHVDKYYGAWTFSFEDKLSIATLGLIDAAIRFDLSLTTRLTTFAKWRIKARFSEANERDGLIGGSIVKRGRQQRRIDGVSIGSGSGDVSLDAPVGDDEDGEPRNGHDLLAHSDGGKWAAVIEHTLDVERKTAAVLRAVKTLKWREREFFRWRFVDKLTHQAIADRRGITASRVGQIEAALVKKLAIAIAKHEKRRSDHFSIPAFGARYGERRLSARYREVVRRLHNQWPHWPDRMLWPGDLTEGRPSACYSTPRLMRMSEAVAA
jgi:RNA polymerase sigma factor (sigma-70 family)